MIVKRVTIREDLMEVLGGDDDDGDGLILFLQYVLLASIIQVEDMHCGVYLRKTKARESLHSLIPS